MTFLFNMPDKDTQITGQQKKALHVYFKLLADELNDAGLDMRKTLRPGIDIPWGKMTVKEYLWKSVQKTYIMKASTNDLTIKEVNEVYEILNRYVAEKFGLTVDFPSIEQITLQLKNAKKDSSKTR